MKGVGSILAFVAFVVGSNCIRDADMEKVESEWEAWKLQYNKIYDNDKEDKHRFRVWNENRIMIEKHNNVKELKEVKSYTLKMNKFGDLTQKEFVYHIHGHNESCIEKFKNFEKKNNIPVVNPGLKYSSKNDLPDSVDWTTSGNYVTPVKDQGNCGSCWAFSATGSTESRYAIATGELNSLSEQELVDCDSLNAGCNGGNMDSALYYVKKHNGLSLESDYVYTAEDGTCESNDYTHYSPINGISIVEHDNSTALMAAVVEGPVSIGIQADQMSFQFYSDGVLDGRCGTNIDHGVLVVGYGTDTDTGIQYWKVKNSWGQDWGEDGYVRICKDCDKNDGQGECCILCQPSFPTV